MEEKMFEELIQDFSQKMEEKMEELGNGRIYVILTLTIIIRSVDHIINFT